MNSDNEKDPTDLDEMWRKFKRFFGVKSESPKGNQSDLPKKSHPKDTSAVPPQELVSAVNVLAQCTFDDEAALFADSYMEYEKVVSQVASFGDAAVPVLATHLGKGPFVYLALGAIGSAEAARLLKPEILSTDWRRVAAAANALKQAARADTLPSILHALQQPIAQRIAEAHHALAAAAISLRSLQNNSGGGVDRETPYDSIVNLFNCDDRFSPSKLALCREYVKELPTIEFKPTTTLEGARITAADAKARSWNMLAVLLYYSRYPDASSFDRPCAEAARCWEQALELDPKNGRFKELVRSVREP